jgi:hypothetical protein
MNYEQLDGAILLYLDRCGPMGRKMSQIARELRLCEYDAPDVKIAGRLRSLRSLGVIESETVDGHQRWKVAER